MQPVHLGNMGSSDARIDQKAPELASKMSFLELPLDILNELSKFFTLKDLGRLRLVNHQIKTFVDIASSHTLRTLAKELLMSSEKMASSIEDLDDKSMTLFKIARVQAKWQYRKAIMTANQIPEGNEYFSKERCLLEIVEVQAEQDVVNAMVTVKLLPPDSLERELALLQIVSIQAQTSIKAACETTKQLSRPYDICWALIHMANAQVERDIKKANEMLLSVKDMIDMLDSSQKAKLLGGIAQVQAKFDTNEAIETAKKIGDQEVREAILANFALQAAKHNIDSALKIANMFLNLGGKEYKAKCSLASALATIAETQVQTDFETINRLMTSALNIALTITNPFYRGFALSRIASSQANYDVTGAKALAKTIYKDFMIDNTLIEIVRIQLAKGDIAGAKLTICEISAQEKKDEALACIVKIDIKNRNIGLALLNIKELSGNLSICIHLAVYIQSLYKKV